MKAENTGYCSVCGVQLGRKSYTEGRKELQEDEEDRETEDRKGGA